MQVFSWQDFFLGFFRRRFFRAGFFVAGFLPRVFSQEVFSCKKKNCLERDRSDYPYIYIHTRARAPGDKFL